MTLIPNFKVGLVRGHGSPRDWEGSFAIEPGATLEDVHALTQNAVQFDDDHGYEFYIARTFKSRPSEVFDDENGGIYRRTLASLFPLPAKHALFYCFDPGDNWIFEIKAARGGPLVEACGEAESGLMGALGTRPVQYPDGDE
ncbi:hypothetical protein [Aquimonas sp.]|jgi:hypothetical protein|uniref:IS1096 element passenger TnpR family protein n=1 Tax=Aquimonas sp. TaxID=1872588 RepID=UPI0037BE917F